MTAGSNITFQIWRMSDNQDDYVGGNVISGSVVYTDVRARMQAKPINQVFIEQGLETHKVFSAIIIPGTLDIRERDEVEVTNPFDHHFYGNKFRVEGVEYSDFNPRDARNYIMLQLTRFEMSHTQQ